MHVDDFIGSGPAEHSLEDRRVAYARWVLMHMRLPAVMQYAFMPFVRDHKLFCTYKGRRWRVTGASRLGDVWLAEDFAREAGYDHRVGVNQCSEWGDAP